MTESDNRRLSVSLVDVHPGAERQFLDLATAFEALLVAKGYGRAETIRDEGQPLQFPSNFSRTAPSAVTLTSSTLPPWRPSRGLTVSIALRTRVSRSSGCKPWSKRTPETS